MATNYTSVVQNSLIGLIVVYLLQFFLCTRKNKFLGLVLPAYYFISSVVLLVNSFSSAYFAEMNRLFHVFLVFIVPNVNTVLFLFMYAVLRAYKFRGDSDV